MSELAEAPDEQEDEETGSSDELVCPDCDAGPFTSKLSLGAHRYHKHGVKGTAGHKKSSGRPRGRPPGSKNRGEAGASEGESARQARRRKAVRDTLVEFVSFMDEARGRSDAPAADLSDVIRRDADKIANSVAWIAERFLSLGRMIDLLLGHGGPLTVARGFLGVGTWTLAHWRETLRHRAETEQLVEPGQDAEEIAEAMAREYLL